MRRLALVVAAALVVVACSGSTDELPPYGDATASYVTPLMGEIQALSPDGELLVVSDGNDICLQSIDEGLLDCFVWIDEPDPIRPRFASDWSSDGSSLFFSDLRRLTLGQQPPVWSLESGTGEFTRLLDPLPTAAVDVAVNPATGTVAAAAVIGAESILESEDDIGLYLFGDYGGPRLLLPGFNGSIEWTPSGDALVASALLGDREVFRIDAESRERVSIVGEDDELGAPVLGTLSADGRFATVTYLDALSSSFRSPGTPFVGVLDLETGAVEPIPSIDDTGFVGAYSAVFSADGAAVAYLYTDGIDIEEDPLVLAARPTAGGDAMLITDQIGLNPLDEPITVVSLFSTTIDPVWTDDRIVFASFSWALVVDLEG